MEKERVCLPKIGQRIVRSVIGVALCFVVYFIRGQKGIPFYSALAVLQCIQPYLESSTKMARQRSLGTFIGAFWGLIVLLIELYIFPPFVKESIWGYFFISIATGAVLYTTVLLNRKNTSYFSCVVFLSITVMHMTDRSPFVFVLNRIIDTLIGVFMAVLVNAVHFPRDKNRDILFVSGIDDALLNKKNAISAYSKVELNRLISDGAKFTVSTMRTPASIMDALSGIHFQTPIITMDGAALFDMNENEYLLTYQIPYWQATQIVWFLESYDMTYFTNVILDDLLIIYYRELKNDAEKDIYKNLKKSPYRNYVRRELPEEQNVIYFMIVDVSEKIQELYEGFEKEGFLEKYKIITYASTDYPGYSYMKIYNKEATRENMLNNLKTIMKVEKSITFGSIKGEADIWIENSNENIVVKNLKQLYEPIKFLTKKNKENLHNI